MDDDIRKQASELFNSLSDEDRKKAGLDITTRKVLYILETRKTIPSDWTSTQINEMYAKMIARHIHKYFELKGGI